jgi:hypothetical protein
MVRAWLKPTYHAWFSHASLIWLISTGLYQKGKVQAGGVKFDQKSRSIPS